jgi:hypothetical protein
MDLQQNSLAPFKRLLTITPHMGFMREVHLFIPAILALCLGGCASGANTGVCARFSNTNLSTPPMKFTYFRKSSNSHHRIAGKRTLKPVSATAVAPAETPEPRAFSTEWWARENARVNKALVICRDCVTTPAANVTQLEKTRLIAQPTVTIKSELP